jgi:predicted aldo/keto reductase-like oxidoreductase
MIVKDKFGKTGHLSTRVIFGGVALGKSDRETANRVLNMLLDYGINHIDTSTSYGDSEKWIGTWMKDHREDFFLATKIDSRSYAGAKKEFGESLEKLNTDHVDLLQMHELVKQEDLDTVFGKDGAVSVLEEAKRSGRASFIGITGHGIRAPYLLKQCLDRHAFDSVLLPFNYAFSLNEEYAEGFSVLRKYCQENRIALQTMKAIAKGEWGQQEKTRSSWYQPLEDQEDIDTAVHWVLGRPGVFTCSVGDKELFPKVLDAAERYSGPPSEEEMRELVSRTGMRIPPQPAWPRINQ